MLFTCTCLLCCLKPALTELVRALHLLQAVLIESKIGFTVSSCRTSAVARAVDYNCLATGSRCTSASHARSLDRADQAPGSFVCVFVSRAVYSPASLWLYIATCLSCRNLHSVVYIHHVISATIRADFIVATTCYLSNSYTAFLG